MATVTAFKIRHKVTGLYRKAGGSWSKVGKVWANIGHLKNHLNCHRGSTGLPDDAVNWEVVVLEIQEAEAKTIPVLELKDCAATDGPLKLHSVSCPRDNAALHFEMIGGMRVKRQEGHEFFYQAWCPTCGKHYDVKAGKVA